MRTAFTALCVTAMATPAFAQLTVQQPVIGTIGGNFSVIVPDRGATFLGGVGSAGESRSSYGLPFLRGSSVGRFTNNRSLWAHSRIIDLGEMDRMVLEAADRGSRPGFAQFDSPARVGIAYSERSATRTPAIRENDRYSRSTISRIASALSAAGRNSSNLAASRSAESGRPARRESRSKKPSTTSRALDPVRNYQLGLQAEESGKSGLAQLHYRTAAQHGSVPARQRLEQLSQQAVAANQ